MKKAKTHNRPLWRDKLAYAALLIFYGVLAYVPVHILLSTWIGTSLGILEFAKVAKDIIMVVGFLCIALATPVRTYKHLFRNNLVRVICIYAGLAVGLALLRPTDQDAEILGIVYNTRYLLFALYAVLLAVRFRAEHILKRATQIILAVSVPVLIFGLLQYLLLSPTALEHLGYSRENGVLPFFAIDDKPDLERIMSTIRDPNSYGSYLIIVGSLAACIWAHTSKLATKKLLLGIFSLTVLNLLLTFSRSAWIGFTLAVITILAASPQRKKITTYVTRYAFIGLALILLSLGGLFIARESYFVENVIFHADENTTLENPNELRSRFYAESVDAMVENPVGYGPGTAGLVSIRNDERTILNENYYLQIAHEVGVAGLILFLVIIFMAAHILWSARNYAIPLGLFAALIGLIFTNLLVHIWSNEAVAYTWWGLAGLVFSMSILHSNHKKQSAPRK